jgi:hypothetical protein
MSNSIRQETQEVSVTPEMIEAGVRVIVEWFPYDGERRAISQAEARLLARAVLEMALAPACFSPLL